MTKGEQIIKKLQSKKIEMEKIREEMDELDEDLVSYPLKFKGKDAIVEYCNGQTQEVLIYTEEEDTSVWISFDQFLEYIKKEKQGKICQES